MRSLCTGSTAEDALYSQNAYFRCEQFEDLDSYEAAHSTCTAEDALYAQNARFRLEHFEDQNSLDAAHMTCTHKHYSHVPLFYTIMVQKLKMRSLCTGSTTEDALYSQNAYFRCEQFEDLDSYEAAHSTWYSMH
ncbi:hypothetical protein ANTQUA_LOCUS2266 [Anthophora quadrimaculata]